QREQGKDGPGAREAPGGAANVDESSSRGRVGSGGLAGEASRELSPDRWRFAALWSRLLVGLRPRVYASVWDVWALWEMAGLLNDIVRLAGHRTSFGPSIARTHRHLQ